MGHIVNAKDQVYRALAERLNKNPVGAPINETLMAILHRLYTESEAMVGSKFPLVPMTLEQIAGITGTKEDQLKTILDGMADKGLVLDIPRKDTFYYMLAPVVVGFFEYTFMRARDDIDMKELAELFETYFQSSEVREEFSGVETMEMRTLVYESLIPVAVETEVLDYERASEIIRQSGGGSISICACRHKALHLGKSCGAPLEVCTSLGGAAEWIVRRGLGKPATVDELLRVLEKTEKLGLVHQCDNVLNKPTYICHCCGCCCQVLRGINEFGKFSTHPSNFIPTIDTESCVGCGTCADSCHINAISLQDNGNGTEVPAVNKNLCIGCGACASKCPSGAINMSQRSILHVPPKNIKEKFLRIAKEKGKL
ncbi:4Fe-4S binding protein [Desulfotruncus alcoholivorax]|uniref:4Fe-4S binding protein n=1 Tax=Desulfotruncus alcoholivorax TaxID=265477 RepID=UPI0003FF4222|nr:4Fe-4S binding protein [Desulfotruncus alcoholivorax]